jgi:hypothetical protein
MGEEMPTEMGEQQSSPFDNEFKTISTVEDPTHSQPHQEDDEEEPVLFPDASETRAKKVGYN